MHATRVATNGNDVTGWLSGAASPGCSRVAVVAEGLRLAGN